MYLGTAFKGESVSWLVRLCLVILQRVSELAERILMGSSSLLPLLLRGRYLRRCLLEVTRYLLIL